MWIHRNYCSRHKACPDLYMIESQSWKGKLTHAHIPNPKVISSWWPLTNDKLPTAEFHCVCKPLFSLGPMPKSMWQYKNKFNDSICLIMLCLRFSLCLLTCSLCINCNFQFCVFLWDIYVSEFMFLYPCILLYLVIFLFVLTYSVLFVSFIHYYYNWKVFKPQY